MAKKRVETPITVRFPPALVATMRQLAARDRRSLNAEIVTLCERGAIAALAE